MRKDYTADTTLLQHLWKFRREKYKNKKKKKEKKNQQ